MLLRWLISTIGFAALKGDVAAMAGRAGRRGILYALAVLFWVSASALVLAACTVWLAGRLGTIAACAIVAAALALIGLGLQLGLALSAHRRRHVGITLPPSDLTPPVGAGAASQNGGVLGSLAIVAIVGWLLGRRIIQR